MSSIDDRIVNMQFNNKQFVGGAQESEKALESLEKSLAKTAQSKGLEGMANSIETVKTKFGAMQVAGVAAVATIASKATAAGISFLKSLTIDPILDGFREYQTNLESVQTIMSNTGKSVKVVNAGLDQLNEYADQTIYNFSQMARNVGTFTAAGVNLKTSIASIQGISNLAALSGSSAQQASTAMYQLSQAIAAGRVNLQDWNSVVNAGMGGKQFQLALSRTAEAMGSLEKGAAVLADGRLKIAGKSFRESISAVGDGPQWLTSEVLTSTLAALDGRFSKTALAAQGLTKAEIEQEIAQARLNLAQKEGVKFTDEQFKAVLKMSDAAYAAATQIKTLPQLVSVIRESIGSTFSGIFRTVLGDFKQSKKLWSDVGDAIIGRNGFLTKGQAALTNVFETWADPEGFDGRSKVLDAMGKVVENLSRIFVRVKKAFQDIFPPGTDNILMRITDAFTAFANATEVTGHIGIFKDLRVTFQAFFAVVHAGLSILGGFKSLILGFFGAIFQDSAKASGGLLSIVADLARLIVKIDEFLFQGGKFQEVMGGIGQVAGTFVRPFVQAIGLVISALGALTSGKGLDEFSENIDAAKVIFGGFADSLQEGLEKIFGPMDKLSGIGSRLKAKLGGLDFLPDFGNIGEQIVNGITSGLESGAVQSLKDAITKLGTAIVDWFKDVLGIHSPAEETKPIGENIVRGIGEGILDAIRFIGQAIGEVIGAIMSGLTEGFSNMDPLGFASILNAIFTGALILTIRKFFQNANVFGSIIGVFDQLTDTLKTMQRAVRATALMQIAIAVGVLAAALIGLSFIPMDKLGKGISAIAALMALLTATLFLFDRMMSKSKFEGNLAVMSLAFVSMATAITMLAGALALLALIPMEKLGSGITAIAALLGIMTMVLVVMTKHVSDVGKAASAMIAMAFAIDLLAGALALLALIPMDALGKGVSAIAVLLLLMTGFMIMMSKATKTAPLAATGMIAMAFAIDLVAGALALLAAVPAKALEKSLKTVLIMLGSMTLAMLAMGGTGAMGAAGAAGMVAMAFALGLLVPLLVTLSLMSWEAMTKGMLGLVGILAIMVIGVVAIGSAATAVAPGLLAFGYAVALVGAGMLAFGTGFAIMAAAGVAGVAVLTAAFNAFIALLPSIGVQLAAMFVSFIQTIAAMAPKLRKAFGTIFESLIGVVRDAIPVIGALFREILDEGFRILRDYIDNFVELGIFAIDEFLKSVADHLPSIIDSGTAIIVSLIEGIGEASEQIYAAATDTLIEFLEAIDARIEQDVERIRDLGFSIAGHILDGMTGGLAGRAGDVIGSIFEGAGNVAGTLTFGLLGRGVADGAGVEDGSAFVNRYEQTGRTIMQALAKGMKKESASKAVQAALNIADQITIGVQSKVLKDQQEATREQGLADAAQARADLKARLAKSLRGSDPKLAKEFKRQAEKAQKDADLAQAEADAAARRVQKRLEYLSSSDEEKADMQSERAQALAARAQQALAEANEKAKLAREIQKTNAKLAAKLREESKADIADAKAAAAAAKAANAEAQRLYELSLGERLTEFANEQVLESGTKDEKLAVLQSIVDTQQDKAEALKAEAQAYFLKAQQLADTDARKAGLFLELAEQKADEAQQAADKAQQALDQSNQLRGIGTGGSGAAANITPSRTVLEDAASAVDRYTESLALAQELAGATQTVLQFEQNNYSPESLSEAEIYRQSRNLLSTAEIKMTELST